MKRRKMETDSIKFFQNARDTFNKLDQPTIHFPEPRSLTAHQTKILHHNRCVLVDWLLDVKGDFGTSLSVFFAAVKLYDTYVKLKPCSKDKYQLVGMSCMLIASKMYDIDCMDISYCVHICDNCYTIEEFLQTERDILVTFDFNIISPNPYKLLNSIITDFYLVESVEHVADMRSFLEFAIINNFDKDVDDILLVCSCVFAAFVVNGAKLINPILRRFHIDMVDVKGVISNCFIPALSIQVMLREHEEMIDQLKIPLLQSLTKKHNRSIISKNYLTLLSNSVHKQ